MSAIEREKERVGGWFWDYRKSLKNKLGLGWSHSTADEVGKWWHGGGVWENRGTQAEGGGRVLRAEVRTYTSLVNLGVSFIEGAKKEFMLVRFAQFSYVNFIV